jgi:hypothetical protein
MSKINGNEVEGKLKYFKVSIGYKQVSKAFVLFEKAAQFCTMPASYF